MNCDTIAEARNAINAYLTGDLTGRILLVNVENYADYESFVETQTADGNVRSIYVSNTCGPQGLPNVAEALSTITGGDSYCLVGLSQALMLKGQTALDETIASLLGMTIKGRAVVLLDHCEHILKRYIRRGDPRVNNHALLVKTSADSALPSFKLVKSAELSVDSSPLTGFKEALWKLELNPSQSASKEITVVSALPIELFANSVYTFRSVDDAYAVLSAKNVDIKSRCKREDGTDEQWTWLNAQLQNGATLADVVRAKFNSLETLYLRSDVFKTGDELERWLWWLALKVYAIFGKKYLERVVKNCNCVDDFVERAYMELLDVECDDPEFDELYKERKELVAALPQVLSLVEKYCDAIIKKRRYGLFYFTDASEREKHDFLKCLSLYEYSHKEWNRALNAMSHNLALYMQDFRFDKTNAPTSIQDEEEAAAFRDELTSYFTRYKRQKLVNKLDEDFLQDVEKYALTRPYNKLSARGSFLSHMKKEKTAFYFFDALGVEYMAFIAAKCKELGLTLQAATGRCELPSITSLNKEFYQNVSGVNWNKIEGLDEIKHDNPKYDYQQCKFPLHIFEELELIEKKLKEFQSKLTIGNMDKCVIVSDHGASRLAVIYGREVEAALQLDEKGQHSGRCCPADESPELPYAAYENGFSVLANYERFKGGRQANLEVHGGAALEEVLVPVLTISKPTEELEVSFVEPRALLKIGVPAELKLCSNKPLVKPALRVNGKLYEGVFLEDAQHALFTIDGLRKGTYQAEVLDAGKYLGKTLEFELYKKTGERKLF